MRYTAIEKIVTDFKQSVKVLYGARLKKIILYGSWARRQARHDSDIDVAVVLGGHVAPGREIDRMIDLITELNLKFNILLSVYPVSEKTYERMQTPLLMNMRREGAVV